MTRNPIPHGKQSVDESYIKDAVHALKLPLLTQVPLTENSESQLAQKPVSSQELAWKTNLSKLQNLKHYRMI